MPNPFTSESRDEILSVNLEGICTKLRVPSSLRFLFSTARPADRNMGDTIIRDRLNGHLIPLIVGGWYPEVQRTLDALFGPRSYETSPETTLVASGNNRSQNGKPR